jgi:hypothetical protein
LKIDKKRIRRTLYWFAAELAVLAVFMLFLTYRPKGYEPLAPDTSGRVSTYLTHKLAQDFYNGAQLGEPFELTIDEAGVNDIIMTGEWIGAVSQSEASLPTVHFQTDRVVVMASAFKGGMEFVATIEVKPWVDAAGKVNVKLESVKVGAVPLTLAAKTVAKKMYNEQIGELPKNDMRVLVGKAILEDQPFDPVMEIGGKAVRISRIEVGDKVMKLGITPVKAK